MKMFKPRLLLFLALSTLARAGSQDEPLQAIPVPQATGFLSRLRKAAEADPASRLEESLFESDRKAVSAAIAPMELDSGFLLIYDHPAADLPPIKGQSQPILRDFTVLYTSPIISGRGGSGEEPNAVQYSVSLQGWFSAVDCDELETCQIRDARFTQACSGATGPLGQAAGQGGSSSAGGG